ncbi:ATP-binding protein [Actinoplanes sp. NPDC051851]|uniref:DEAD/DEAH box helicase n=1 Tax=Actinoplanes sp. NPDC051851 TaxID=3154753 RepID=UPI0034150603
MLPPDVLAVLAELAPAAAERPLDVTRGGQSLVWLDAERAPRTRATDRLAALDVLHREERILHRGWGFLAGSVEIDGKNRKIRVPLLTQPVHLERSLPGYRLIPAGDVEVTPLVEDRDLAAAMEAAPGLAAPGWLSATGSRAWLRSVAEATGLRFDAITEPPRRMPTDRLILITGSALFVVRDVFGGGLGNSLRNWSARDLTGTAFAAIYGVNRSSAVEDETPVVSPLPLSEDQEDVVRHARTAPVTVVSGPPGSGKSHTVVAAALEVVHRGGSVLVATQSPHAAEVLAGLLARYPGPVPVLFGDAAARDNLATDLTRGADQGVSAGVLRADRAAVASALSAVRAIRTALQEALAQAENAATLDTFAPRLPGLAADVPGAFHDDVDPALVRDLLGRSAAGGWWSRLRARSAHRRARRMVRPLPGVPRERVEEALAASTAQRAAAHLAATGGTDLARRWATLHAAEDALRTAIGAAMRNDARSAARWDHASRRAAGALAAALRAGRNRRRELLTKMDAAPLVRALPLWIGTVADVEDLLPPSPGLFDLVVIDEASHVDQIRAAPVLSRARRALVVGDPRQLRFVSFVSDVDVSQVLDRHGADERLDVRRMSTYDLAAGAAPVTWLASHFRSVPHLIGFSAKRFYQDRVAVMTRTPTSDSLDAIDVVHAPGDEVPAALREIRSLASSGHRGIAVISPFRAQADALEAALITSFSAAEIEDLRLRVGTVHAFQGSEADAVVVSLGLDDTDGPSRRRFVTDPQLFNVMVTRARKRLVVVHSLTAPSGLIGDFLTYAAGFSVPAAPFSPMGWAARIATELAQLEIPVLAGYTVGPWTIDLVAGAPAHPVGVLCGVHPDGVPAHLARQSALHRAGWRLLDAFPTRWHGDPRRAALEIAAATQPNGTYVPADSGVSLSITPSTTESTGTS